MLNPQFILPIAPELVVDLFAGGGGASTGIEQAIGRHVDIAINHDPEAVSLHEANHPQTRHFVSDVFEVDPVVVTDGQPVGLLWASPDCKHFSKAKGGKPVSKKIRSLAWVVVKWAKAVRPRVICLENVEEFQTWGPLGADNMPCPRRKGATFARWKRSLEGLGYVVEHRELRACDYGAPTIRKRLFLVARRDGQPVVWPEATHAAPDSLPVRQKKLKPWRTAAECIDWSVPAPSIFERTRPLADATCRRIAKGIVRYVIDAAEPFIVPMTHSGGDRVHSAREPLRTVTTAQRGELALAVPTIISMGYGERPGQQPRVPGIEVPLSTITAQGQHQALVSAFLAKHYTGVVGGDMAAPMGTATTVDHHSLVAANLIHMGHGEGKDGGKRFSHGVRDVDTPLNTITASGAAAGLVQAFLIKYYGTDQDPALREPLHTVTTKDRFGLVMVKGEPYAIVDIGLRMLTPRELYRAQGFPESYRIDLGADGRPLTKTAQVRMCGNSVCPPLARALVAANYVEMVSVRAAA
ncbi:MAG: DNA cytosine methyltransferase [Hydrogenophaga sp.]|uniref:DNA cytosine methyltransferase n=1 Tax=Hydrogenophaga sp. TaxID=1904254 RepID=UPI002735D460|nr:DNA cytosine methyltransferase [Hydrogenophaga sp.]MDP3351851.1 DNA cytosine methyltransferase [Hydrogenophaga sp.]